MKKLILLTKRCNKETNNISTSFDRCHNLIIIKSSRDFTPLTTPYVPFGLRRFLYNRMVFFRNLPEIIVFSSIEFHTRLVLSFPRYSQGTMTSADFLSFVVTTKHIHLADKTSLGKNIIFLLLYPSSLLMRIPSEYWTLRHIAHLSFELA